MTVLAELQYRYGGDGSAAQYIEEDQMSLGQLSLATNHAAA